MLVLDTVLLAHSLHRGRNVVVACRGNTGEKVVLNLVVEAAMHDQETEATHIRGRLNLVLGPAGALGSHIKARGLVEVVGDDEEETEVGTSDGTHHEDVVDRGDKRASVVEADDEVAEDVEDTEEEGDLLFASQGRVNGEATADLHTVNVADVHDEPVNAKKLQKGPDVHMLVGVVPLGVVGKLFVENQEILAATNIGIEGLVGAVHMVTNKVLTNPQHAGSANVILSVAQNLVDPSFARDGTMVGIMLDVETNVGEVETKKESLKVGGAVDNPGVVKRENREDQESRAKMEPPGGIEAVSSYLLQLFVDFLTQFGVEGGMVIVNVLRRSTLQGTDRVLAKSRVGLEVSGVQHVVGSRHIMTTIKLNNVTTRVLVLELGHVIDSSLDGKQVRRLGELLGRVFLHSTGRHFRHP
eukprot:Colp12_sorted_trinity150504_noHs@14738